MKEVREVLKKYDLKPFRYQKMGKVMVVETEKGSYVVKEKRIDNTPIYQYLNSRTFGYYPKIITSNDENYEITEYIEEISMPDEQKILDLVDLVTLLHNKTTHYREVDEDDYKKIYEDIENNILYLGSYYDDIITTIESKVYMSPSEYLLVRNISKVYSSLYFCKKEIEVWYTMVKEKRKQRMVVLHNNLNLSHFIRNHNSYLINWDKSKIDIPIFDLYKLYRNHFLEFDFSEILKRYENSYPLSEDERKLFFILISLPDKIEFKKNEFDMCHEISEKIDYLYKTDRFISPYYPKNGK